MATSPKFKVYNPGGEYVAACKYAGDAAAIVATYGEGAEIRLGHKRLLYKEGTVPEIQADDSYDAVAEYVLGRLS